MDRKPILELKNVTVEFGSGKKKVVAAKDISFQVFPGEIVGLVGESGSGKTTIGRAIMRINELASGEIFLKGERISGKVSREVDKMVTQKIQMIFQDPMASLNERAKVDYIVSEGLYNLKNYKSEEERKNRMKKALIEVGLLPEFSDRFPHEFSGGQRQRIGIARALIMGPDLIVADEPISALDVSIRAQILNILSKLRDELGMTFVFIAHDLSIVRFFTDRTAVIHKGVIVEMAETEELFKNPLHPYTRSLLSSIPFPDPDYDMFSKIEKYDHNMHQYDENNQPEWHKLNDDHFILGDSNEITKYREMIKKQSN